MVRSLKQLAQRPYCAEIFMGLFNKLKGIPPMGSKRYNRTENISCRRSIFNFLWREADEN